MRPVLLAVVVCVTGLLTAIVVAKALGLDPGFAAGLVSGALTESPAMGTATEAINALPLPEAERTRLVAHIAVADAVCYIFGAVGVILFCSVVGPKLLGIDLVAEALKLEQELGITRDGAGSPPPGTDLSCAHIGSLRARQSPACPWRPPRRNFQSTGCSSSACGGAIRSSRRARNS